MREIIELGEACRERFIDQQNFPELIPQAIWLGGLSDLRGLHRIERSFERRMMLSYALEGGSYYSINGHSGHLHAGKAVFVPTQTPFTLNLDEGGYRRSAWVILERSPVWRSLESLPACFEWPDGPRFARELEALYAESFNPGAHEIRRLLIALCREYLLRAPLLLNAGVRDARLEGLLLEISENLAYPWTLESLCERIHMSKAQLHRCFKAEYGMAPMARVSALRLQRAAVLLDSGMQSISTIGESVGFSNAFYFSTAFKTHFGVSPRAWRHRHRGTAATQDTALAGELAPLVSSPSPHELASNAADTPQADPHR